MSTATRSPGCQVVDRGDTSCIFSNSSTANMDNNIGRPLPVQPKLPAGTGDAPSGSKVKGGSISSDVKHKTGKVLTRKNTPATLPKVDQIYAKEKNNIEALAEEEEEPDNTVDTRQGRVTKSTTGND